MSDLIIPRGDYGYNLVFTVLRNDGNPYVLTLYAIVLKVWPWGMPSNPILEGECEIGEVSNTCYYPVQEGDFDSVGDYLLELEFIQEGVIESTKNYTLRVEESA